MNRLSRGGDLAASEDNSLPYPPQYGSRSGGHVAQPEPGATGGIRIAVIDGTYDAAGLSDVLARPPVSNSNGRCDAGPNEACDHGTFVMGLLGARDDALLPGLCPDCQLIHIPLFNDPHLPSASVDALASAIAKAVAAEAQLINLSLAILGNDTQVNPRLAAALDDAEASGAIIVVAAGNQGRSATSQLLSHPAVIPVVAAGASQHLLPDSNFGPAVAARGVTALGMMPGYATGGGTTTMSGTSVAAAVATGIIGRLWSERPHTSADALRAAIGGLRPRTGPKPPILDRDRVLATLDEITGDTDEAPTAFDANLQGAMSMMRNHRPLAVAVRPQSGPPRPVRPAGTDCGCGAPDGACSCDHEPLSGFVYAIGMVEADYPNIAIEREMQTMAAAFGLATAPTAGALRGLTEDPVWQHNVLSHDPRATRYLARQLRWRLTIEDFPVYLLQPTDPALYDDLIEALVAPPRPSNLPRVVPAATRSKRSRQSKPDEYRAADAAPAHETERLQFGAPFDLDVIVGVVGPHTPEGTIVALDQVFQIDHSLINPTGLGYYSQLADNHGLTDEDRASNFLTARYRPPPSLIASNYQFVGLRMAPSRLGADLGRVVRAIYTFRNDKADTREYFVRVDVTHEFPMIVSPWAHYIERGVGA